MIKYKAGEWLGIYIHDHTYLIAVLLEEGEASWQRQRQTSRGEDLLKQGGENYGEAPACVQLCTWLAPCQDTVQSRDPIR